MCRIMLIGRNRVEMRYYTTYFGPLILQVAKCKKASAKRQVSTGRCHEDNRYVAVVP